MKIPGAERASSGAKVRDYLLSAEHRVGSAKARFFTQLGFEQRNWETLQSELHRFATYEAHLGTATKIDLPFANMSPGLSVSKRNSVRRHQPCHV